MERIIVDAHCDTITKLMETGEVLLKNNLHIDLESSKKLGGHVQFFAAFFDARKATNHFEQLMRIINKFDEEIEANHEDIQKAFYFDDIIRITQSGKTAAILSVEGGDALEGNIDNLKKFYDLGVRSMSLTWNYRNALGCGAMEATDTGLTALGRKICKEMNKLGMIIDVSHLSFKGFWDVIEITKNPIIASHSNAKGVCKHERNLCNRQITEIKDNGGVIGINFYPNFLNISGIATINDIIKHIEYICAITGSKHVGFGSDFDGIETVPTGMEKLNKIEDIFNILAKKNYTQEQIDDIAGRNFLRVINRVVG